MTIPASQNWFALPRVTRATMVAQAHIETVTALITKLDQDDYWFHYSEAVGKRREKKKGRGSK